MSHLNVTAMKTGGAYHIRNFCSSVLVFVFTFCQVFAEIRNGYEKEITTLRRSLESLKSILSADGELRGQLRRKIELRITEVQNAISYYELTQSLLTQFKMVSPLLYAEIDSIKDKRGRPVNIYVKFTPRNETTMKSWGTTYIDQSTVDEDAYHSEYGELTVSVKIWIVTKALFVLAHELGHVKYQVPHLAEYITYYKDRYNAIADQYDNIGHNMDDASGNSANEFERKFQKDYTGFLKMANEKIQDPLVIMDRIRKSLSNNI